MPLSVSIIIPAHNAADTLEATLASVLAQTHADWEAIVVENGSSDSTAAVAQQLAERDSRIRAVSSSVRGVSAARNHGLDLARFDWILFLDADDWILPTHLERLTARLAADSELDAAHCGWRRIGPDGLQISEEFGPGDIDLFPRFARTCAITIHSCITRRSLIETAGRFDPSLKTCEDWDLWQRLARIGCRFGAVREALACYRARPGSASMNAAQLVNDCRIVIARGGSADPRIKSPKAEYASGLPGLDVASTLLYTVAWAGGLAIGGGRDAAPLLDLIGSAAGVALDPGGVADCIHCCALLPKTLPVSAWAEEFDTLAPLLDRFLQALELRTGQKGLALAVRTHLVQRALNDARRPRPFSVGTLYAVEVEITAPIPDLSVPAHIERLHCIVRCEGETLGTLELPVFDGLVPSAVLADAIAAEFAWAIIGRFFEKKLYPHFHAEKDSAGWKVRRGPLQLASALPGNGRISWAQVHDEIGWTVFLQEVWGDTTRLANDFYTPRPDRVDAGRGFGESSEPWLQVEISDPLPENPLPRPRIGAFLTVAGTAIASTRAVAGRGTLSPFALRAALTDEAGFELCRACVREAILGHSFDEPGSLRARLSRRAAHRRSTAAAAIGSIVLPRRPGPCGSSASRRFSLPRVLLPEIAALGQINRTDAPASSVLYLPDLLPSSSSAVMSSGASVSPTTGAFFEELFAEAGNPWHYDTPYEQTKYQHTLSVLPRPRFGRVLELACAEGHFTAQLAPRCDELIATDISRTALQRAAFRCRSHSHVSFAPLDVASDPLPGRFDLIVCSEMLYFLGNIDALRCAIAKIIDSLKPGGWFVTAHAHLVVDEPHRPGFDWDLPFGAKKIADILAESPRVRLERDLRTPLYRVQTYRRQNPVRRWMRPRPPERVLLPQPTELPPHAATHALWQGGVPQRLQGPPKIVTAHLPILMYHHLAPQANGPERYVVTPEMFEQQLRFLADRGYRSITLEEWRRAMIARRPLPGRCVMITFDDANLNFYEHAWPLLRRHGYGAMMFVPTRDIPGAPQGNSSSANEMLLSWDQLRELQNQGLQIGSHTESHPMLTSLSPTEMAREALVSARRIRDELGTTPVAFAYPYGDVDRIVESVIGAAGYVFGLTCESRCALLSDRLLALPRFEVRGDQDFSDFVSFFPET